MSNSIVNSLLIPIYKKANDVQMMVAAIKLLENKDTVCEMSKKSSGKITIEIGILSDSSAPLYVVTLTEDSVTIVTNQVAVNNGETGDFEIDNESQLQEVDFDLNDYSFHLELENQFNQKVIFYVPNDEMDTVLAVINGKKYDTGFYDCGDFKTDSDYLPVTYNGKVYCYYSYYYASSDYYYPKK